MFKIYEEQQHELNEETIAELNLSDVIGVYVLFNSFGDPIIVNQTHDIENSLKTEGLYNPSYDYFSFWKCKNIDQANQLATQIYHDFDLNEYEKQPKETNGKLGQFKKLSVFEWKMA